VAAKIWYHKKVRFLLGHPVVIPGWIGCTPIFSKRLPKADALRQSAET